MDLLKGIFSPIPTPFAQNGEILFDKLTSNLELWADQPLSGVVMPGSNSEAASLEHEERIKIWKKCVSVLDSAEKTLIAGTGVETTKEAIELTKEAADIGAAAALVIPPYFYKPKMTHEVLMAHFTELAENSPINILLYNVPQFTGVNFSLNTLIALADHPKIVGIKDSSSNLLKMASLMAARPEFKVFAGTGSALLPYLSIGSVGCISALANIAPGPLNQIVEDFKAGDWENARERQLKLVEINAAVTSIFGVPGLKYAMDQLGLFGGFPRRPLLPLNESGKLEIDTLIRKTRLKSLIRTGE